MQGKKFNSSEIFAPTKQQYTNNLGLISNSLAALIACDISHKHTIIALKLIALCNTLI